ncbi:PPE family protein [Mycobacterium branderi]|uniref:PPE family protein PPE45 n=1 Tax=Mycobacterium branderi TaxID=43348 RepID=A0A7I7W885_9MYCO|nr:PPE family protein [Mycobacterium branderi]MCV7234109.1 PPE family protein [Mycobacterium branderi]ORA32233.1 hypothetical protein BST20_25440 [Mycobacterium branderi]BBZ13809.1 putative PPE family protein PPE45 [Mycobacterium branderi]
MDFGALPPEINSGRMYAGPGAGPLLAAAGAWDGIAAELYTAATGYASVISELTSSPWLGPASTAMVAASAPYVSWLSTTAAQAEQTANQARAAAAAYEAAFALTVPPPVIAANRALLMALIATNFFGQNTPAIAATEAHYTEMWAQDAAAMYGYAAASATATRLAAFTSPAQNTDPAGLAGQSAAVAKAAGTSAGASAQTTASTTPQLASAPTISQAVQQVSTSTSSSSSGSSFWDQLNAILGSSSIRTLLTTRIFGGTYFLEGMPNSAISIAQQVTFGPGGTTAGAGGAWYPTPQFAGLGLGHGGGGAVSANVGQAGTIGKLSVPPGWTGATSSALEPQSAGALGAQAPGASANTQGLLRGMPLTGAGRRATGGFVHRYGFRHSVVSRPPSAG